MLSAAQSDVAQSGRKLPLFRMNILCRPLGTYSLLVFAMERADSFQVLVPFYQNVWCQVPEYSNICVHRRENPKSLPCYSLLAKQCELFSFSAPPSPVGAPCLEPREAVFMDKDCACSDVN
jgi:hypothetical protein